MQVISRHKRTIAMLQLLIETGPHVVWAAAALFAGFTLLTGKV
jgi:hypothetical protein